MSWVLILYLSTATGLSSATGGPATVQGFATEAACKATGERIKKTVGKADWYVCVEANLPPMQLENGSDRQGDKR